MHRITNNWSLKLISLTLAILLWSHVRGEVNPLETLSVDVPLSKIPPRDVMLLNKRAVPDTVTVMLSGTRLSLRNLRGGGLDNPLDNAQTPVVLRKSAVHAWLDFSHARLGGDESDVPVKALSRDPDVSVVGVKPATITVSLDRARNVRLPIHVQYTTPMPPGLVVVTARTEPKSAQAFGPSNLLERIAGVRVRVPTKTLVAGPASANHYAGVSLVAEGSDGEEISGVRVSPARCTVGVEIKETEVRRLIKIEARTTGKAALGHRVGTVTVTPAAIAVTATNSVFKQTKTLPVTIDIDGEGSTVHRHARLTLPSGMHAVGEERPSVAITATIESEAKTVGQANAANKPPARNVQSDTDSTDQGQPPVRHEQ